MLCDEVEAQQSYSRRLSIPSGPQLPICYETRECISDGQMCTVILRCQIFEKRLVNEAPTIGTYEPNYLLEFKCCFY